MMQLHRIMLSAAALMVAGWQAVPAAAQDESRNSSSVITTDRGTATVTRSSIAGEDGRSGTVAIEGANGRTATREFARRHVPGEGVTAQSTLTGPDDRSRTVVREAVRVGPRALGRSRQITGPRGEMRQERRWVRVRSPR